MNILIFSDTHGSWDSMYQRAIDNNCDIILHCGDIELLKDESDIPFYPAPKRFKEEYLTGAKHFEYARYFNVGSVPIPTYFISGNHENWRALYNIIQGPVSIIKNLYYFGNFGVIKLENGIVIAGLSKIFHELYSITTTISKNKEPERWSPYNKRNNSPKRAAYLHIYDVYTLMRLCRKYEKIDILLLHENPYSIDAPGKVIGAEIITELIKKIRPGVVFCGHMHYSSINKIENIPVINIGYDDFIKLDDYYDISSRSSKIL